MNAAPPVGAWTPADGPLHRHLAPSQGTVRVVGAGMLIVGVALAALGAVKLDTLRDDWFAGVVLVVLVVVIGGLGLAALVGSTRAGRPEIRVGPDGIVSNRLSPQAWAWTDLERVAVHVALRRESLVTTLEPKALRTRVRITIEVQPTSYALARVPGQVRARAAARDAFAFQIRVMEPTLTTGENIPVVRDLDAAFRTYGARVYAGVSERLTHTL